MKEYATHDYDAVLDLYYAKARFYDAYNRTFTAQDPILDPSQYDLREYVKEPMALVQYLYVRDNAVVFIDPFGLEVAVVNVSGSKLFVEVDTKDTDSTVEMLNLYTYAKTNWKSEITAYSYDLKKVTDLTEWDENSVSDLLQVTGFVDATGQRRPTGNYFTKYYCEEDSMYHYNIHMPEYGSSDYLAMVNCMIPAIIKGRSYSNAVQRIMRDINNYRNINSISDANFEQLGDYFSSLIIAKEGVSNQAEHYFRNILNRVPTTYEQLLENKEKWELLDVDAAIYHMNQFGDDSGLYNAKFISKDGHYEAVYNIVTGELVTDYINMGTYNYSGNYGQGTLPERAIKKVYHLNYDMVPYYRWGNTDDKNTAEQIKARVISPNKERYDNEYNMNADFRETWDEFLSDWR